MKTTIITITLLLLLGFTNSIVSAQQLWLEWNYNKFIDAPATFYIKHATNVEEGFKVITILNITSDITSTNNIFKVPIASMNLDYTNSRNFFFVTLSNIHSEGPPSNITNLVRVNTGSITNRIIKQ